MSKENKKILIVAAHPDDEILGCGATVPKLIREGCKAASLILGEGVTSRDQKRDAKKRKEEIRQLNKQAHKANALIGIKKVFTYDFPDNRFDTVALLDIVKVIEKIKDDIKPDIIFTHYRNDLNIDHQITYKAVITASRPLPGELVKEIYSFQIPTSTEWNYPFTFNPTVFFDITKTIDKKIEALKIYRGEIRSFPHPRSEEAVKLIARNWGIKAGLPYAEAFELIRYIR